MMIMIITRRRQLSGVFLLLLMLTPCRKYWRTIARAPATIGVDMLVPAVPDGHAVHRLARGLGHGVAIRCSAWFSDTRFVQRTGGDGLRRSISWRDNSVVAMTS